MAEKLRTPLNSTPCTIGELTLDLLLNEEEELSNKVTQFPVEAGGSSTDHVIIDPAVLTITGFVTNAPIRAHSGTLDGKARATRGPDDKLTGTDMNFSELALLYLREIRSSRRVVSVTTKRGTWENMLVERVTRAKNKDTGDALVFTIRLIEYRQVKLVFVDAPKKRTTSARAQPRSKTGKKSTTPQDDDFESIAYKLKHGIQKTFFTKVP